MGCNFSMYKYFVNFERFYEGIYYSKNCGIKVIWIDFRVFGLNFFNLIMKKN